MHWTYGGGVAPTGADLTVVRAMTPMQSSASGTNVLIALLIFKGSPIPVFFYVRGVCSYEGRNAVIESPAVLATQTRPSPIAMSLGSLMPAIPDACPTMSPVAAEISVRDPKLDH